MATKLIHSDHPSLRSACVSVLYVAFEGRYAKKPFRNSQCYKAKVVIFILQLQSLFKKYER